MTDVTFLSVKFAILALNAGSSDSDGSLHSASTSQKSFTKTPLVFVINVIFSAGLWQEAKR